MKHIGNDERNSIKFMLGYGKRTPSRHPNGSRHCHRQSPYYHYAPFTYTTSPPTLLHSPPTPLSYTTFPHTLLNSSPTPISYATFPPSPLSYATHQPLSYTSLPLRSLTPLPRPKATPLPRNQSTKPHSPL